MVGFRTHNLRIIVFVTDYRLQITVSEKGKEARSEKNDEGHVFVIELRNHSSQYK